MCQCRSNAQPTFFLRQPSEVGGTRVIEPGFDAEASLQGRSLSDSKSLQHAARSSNQPSVRTCCGGLAMNQMLNRALDMAMPEPWDHSPAPFISQSAATITIIAITSVVNRQLRGP